MRFINLLANDVWSETDIVNRTEAMVRSTFSEQEETILSRKLFGFMMGLSVPTADEAELLTRSERVLREAQAAGLEARADMLLLQRVLDYEASDRSTPPEADLVELFTLRNPPAPAPEVVPAPEPEPEPIPTMEE